MPATMRIWRCPRCKVGVLAPHRPPADDLRRLCFPCTRRTKRLVYRVLVVRETAKKAKAAAARAKRRKPAPPRKPTVPPAKDLPRAKDLAKYSVEELAQVFHLDELEK